MIVFLSEGVISELLPRIGLVDFGRDTDVDRQVRFPRTGVTSPRALSKLLPRFGTVATAGTIIVPFEPPNIDDLLGSFGFHVRMAKFLDFEKPGRRQKKVADVPRRTREGHILIKPHLTRTFQMDT